MKPRYNYIEGTGKWKCNLCGKLVREYGWQGHNRIHRKKIQDVNKHIDTY